MNCEMVVVRVPRENVNDDWIEIVEWLVASGESVEKGQALAEILNSKTTLQVYAPCQGYVCFDLEPGDRLMLMWAAANRDPSVFPDPARADLRRAGAERHVSLGAGLHFCVGAPLARLEIRSALAVLFRRLPELRLAAPPRRSGRWHFHGHEALRAAW